MKHAPRVARPGDVCILLEPNTPEIPVVRNLQGELQSHYGGTPQQRIHFTCQRFALPDPSQLLRVVDALQTNLAPIAPFPVHAHRLELVEHPFWEFCVLRWDLRRSTPMWNFARTVHYALRQAGMAPHYPCNDDWRPHVTALEAISSPNGIFVNGHHQGQHLYTARRVTLSQVQEGKQFQILASIQLN
ncbi:MAG: 2'-5' RNA ligase family protein [Chloroflexota bacterium]